MIVIVVLMMSAVALKISARALTTDRRADPTGQLASHPGRLQIPSIALFDLFVIVITSGYLGRVFIGGSSGCCDGCGSG